MKPFSGWLRASMLLAIMVFALHPPACAQAGSASASAHGHADQFAPPPPGMPEWNPLIRSGANDLPICRPGGPRACQGKMVVEHPFAGTTHTAPPPPSRSQAAEPQHRISPDSGDIPPKFGEPGRTLPPRIVKWMQSPEYKRWEATHVHYKSYWACWNPKTKEYYGVQVPNLQTPPPANCQTDPRVKRGN